MNKYINKHLWQNQFITDEDLHEKINELSSVLSKDLHLKLDTIILTDACTKLIAKIKSDQLPHLERALIDVCNNEAIAQQLITGICEYMRRENIMSRLKSDLGSYHPFDLHRTDFSKPTYEAWKPLGVQIHIVPGNALNVGVLSMFEGLMAGNINILKNTSRNGNFAQLFMKELIDCDATGVLKHFIYLFEISSKQDDLIQKLINQADLVTVWGGEEAVKSIRNMCPPGVRVVDWGHKISFAYFANKQIQDKTSIDALAEDICRRNQQACTSPQCVLVETDDMEVLNQFGAELNKSLEKISPLFPQQANSQQDKAEITTITHIQKLEASMGNGQVIEAEDHSYRILIDYRSGLQPSPLFRTIWVKPIVRKDIIPVLRPFNLYLQTCGLAANDKSDIYELTEELLKAGLQRITPVGHQHTSYVGEPHDAVYALQRYTKRVSVRMQEEKMEGIPSFSYLDPNNGKRDLSIYPITDKSKRNEEVNPAAKLFLKSGGSSGQTKVAGYSWEDWDLQVSMMCEAFMIAGIHPDNKCAILYSAGNLYGGFISHQKALEKLNTTTLSISSNLDTKTIAVTIIQLQADVVMGMPSFLRKLFREEYDLLKAYTGFKKLIYGGELMTEEQKAWFTNEFGFEEILSPAYASNDALMNGYACKYCKNGEFHVPTKVIDVEILRLDSEESVQENEVGRILITKKSIKDPALNRYEIGDLGKWIHEPCNCGHTSPKFKLMGRHGDLVRCGAKFINYREICQLILKNTSYTDDIQMVIDNSSTDADHITLKLLESAQGKEADIIQMLRNNLKDLKTSMDAHHVTLEIATLPIEQFEIAKASGKVRPIIDNRIAQ